MIRKEHGKAIEKGIEYINYYTESNWLAVTKKELTTMLMSIIDYICFEHNLTPAEREYMREYTKERIAKMSNTEKLKINAY